MAQRVNSQELKKIKQALKSLAAPVLKMAAKAGLVGDERIEKKYEALRELYGVYWFVPAYMWELLARREGSGYNEKANYNPVGLLISFALKDSPASFWEMVERFESAYGVKLTPAGRSLDGKLEELRRFLKRELPSAFYRLVVEEGLSGLVERDGRKVLVFNGQSAAELFRRRCSELVNRVLGNDWSVEINSCGQR